LKAVEVIAGLVDTSVDSSGGVAIEGLVGGEFGYI
jgi:hypothetical protein